MSQVKVCSFSVSLDGYGAGPDQDLANPLGVGGLALHQWFFGTRTFQQMTGHEVPGYGSGEPGVDDKFAERGFANVGAWILGRNMFGPVHGPWPDEGWKGWWGPNPPYHARSSLAMEGGTVFQFVTGGIHEALEQAKEAADGKDVRVGGGVATIREYLQAGLIDEMHLAISPVLLGSGENLLGGIDMPKLGFTCAEHVASALATHVVLKKQA
jgi:dihydrofolate reductase